MSCHLHVVELPEEESAGDGHVLCAAGTSAGVVAAILAAAVDAHRKYRIWIAIISKTATHEYNSMSLSKLNDLLGQFNYNNWKMIEIWTLGSWQYEQYEQYEQTIKEQLVAVRRGNHVDPITPMVLEKKTYHSGHVTGNPFWALRPNI